MFLKKWISPEKNCLNGFTFLFATMCVQQQQQSEAHFKTACDARLSNLCIFTCVMHSHVQFVHFCNICGTCLTEQKVMYIDYYIQTNTRWRLYIHTHSKWYYIPTYLHTYIHMLTYVLPYTQQVVHTGKTSRFSLEEKIWKLWKLVKIVDVHPSIVQNNSKCEKNDNSVDGH
jgi:hypothetical protein